MAYTSGIKLFTGNSILYKIFFLLFKIYFSSKYLCIRCRLYKSKNVSLWRIFKNNFSVLFSVCKFVCLIFNIFFYLSIISVLWTICPWVSQNYPNSVPFSALIRTFESNETATLKNSINPLILSEKSFFEENNTEQIK